MSCNPLVDPRQDNPNPSGSGTDSNAIHKNTAAEISAITGKTTPVDADVLLAEDSADSYNKKKFSWTNIKATLKAYFDTLYSLVGHSHTESDITDLNHNDTNAIHDNVASEISAITEKTTPVDADVFLGEDSADGNNKKKYTWANIKATLKAYFTASQIVPSTSNFDNNLSSADDTVQKALDTLDDMSVGGSSANVETLTADKTLTSADAKYQILSGTTYGVYLPTTASAGDTFTIKNNNAYNTTTYFSIYNENPTVIDKLYALYRRSYVYDGSTWHALMFTENIGMGLGADGNYTDGIGIGRAAYNNYASGVGLGKNAQSNYTYGVGVGYGTANNYSYGVGIGYNATYNRTSGIGIGHYSQFNESYGIGIGGYAQYNKNYSVGIGNYAEYNQSYSIGIGYYAKGNSKGESTAIGSFSQVERKGEYIEGIDERASGNQAAHSKWKYYIETTDGNTYEMYVRGISLNRMEILAKETVQFKIQLVAMDSTNYESKVWTVEGAIKRDASNNTSLVGSITKTVIAADSGTTNWDIYVTADNTNNALKVEVSEVDVATGKTIRWAATSYNTEVRFTY